MTDDLEFDATEDRPGHLLFMDTETTGFANFKIPSDDRAQARIMSIAALVTNNVGKVINGFASLVRPFEWPEVDQKAFETHGLTAEHCERYGLPRATVFLVIHGMLERADRRVGHNIAFDQKLLRGELKRTGLPDHYDKERDYCTMHKSRAICKIPPTGKMMGAGIKAYKSPSLEEAHQHFFDRPIVNAHTALADVNACKKIYFAINPVPGS